MLKKTPSPIEYEIAKKRVTSFFEEAQDIFQNGGCPTLSKHEAKEVDEALSCLSSFLQTDLKETAAILSEIKDQLFITRGNRFQIDRSMYIMLYAVGRTLDDRLPVIIWSAIHPAINEASYSLFYHEKYTSAVDAAFKEVEERLRAMVRVGENEKEPEKISKVIVEVFSKESELNTGDVETLSGEKYRTGLMNTFCGAFSAYRNSGFHSNNKRTKNEAAELIVMCSHFMFVLDGNRRFRT